MFYYVIFQNSSTPKHYGHSPSIAMRSTSKWGWRCGRYMPN